MSFTKSIFHISDIHREGNYRVTNNALISAFESDLLRYASLNPKIKTPTALIVTGDLVYGVEHGKIDYLEELNRQYVEAFEFLGLFANKFLDGDRTKVVILPGNHDSDWNAVKDCFDVVDDLPSKENIIQKMMRFFKNNKPKQSNYKKLILDRGNIRWDWSNLKALKVRNPNEYYKKKFETFHNHLYSFYEGTTLEGKINYEKGWTTYELFDGECTIVCFNSSNFIDYYSSYATITKEQIHDSFNEALSNCKSQLIIGAWHHDLYGSPEREDFISPEILKLLIDKGVRFCLHGHIHKTALAPVGVFADLLVSIPIVGVGSLCATGSFLPEGTSRQYNVIEFNDELSESRVHVREMRGADIFTSGRFDEFSESHMTVKIHKRLIKQVELIKGGTMSLKRVEAAEVFFRDGQYDNCLKNIEKEDLQQLFIREMYFESLFKTSKFGVICEELDEPKDINELAILLNALSNMKLYDRGLEQIERADRKGFAPLKELKERFLLTKRIADGK